METCKSITTHGISSDFTSEFIAPVSRGPSLGSSIVKKIRRKRCKKGKVSMSRFNQTSLCYLVGLAVHATPLSEIRYSFIR